MAKKTFHNLKPERQQQIRELAYREFILNDYTSASLSRIIKELGLAKGSFYRYFSSKKDLYFYLIESSTSTRFSTIEKRIQEPGMTLTKLLLLNWKDKIEFELDHPLETAFQYRVFRERDNEEIGNLEMMFKRKLFEMTKGIITEWFQDEVRKDIDLDFIALHIIQVQIGMYDYLSIKFDDDLLKNIKEGKPLYSLHKSEFEGMILAFTKLLEGGIISKNQDHDTR
ncbi:MAG: TetR/AcrR family transcriptional regulator [Bacteroidales bacterium]|nr:TetR/AcrR family transcriptional regulator [Bacteroidales bacterium]